jgi:hypothetical protein
MKEIDPITMGETTHLPNMADKVDRIICTINEIISEVKRIEALREIEKDIAELRSEVDTFDPMGLTRFCKKVAKAVDEPNNTLTVCPACQHTWVKKEEK